MKIARITGTATATVKDGQFFAVPLVVCQIEDAAGAVLEAGVVAANACGAGIGDVVLLTFGSAARLPASVAGLPVDTAVVAVIDHLE